MKEKDQIISILKEEYDIRLNYFLNEKISIKDKRGMNLIKDAEGLKVRDKAGFEYTVGGLVKKGVEEFVKLFLPEFGRDMPEGESISPLYEFDLDEEDDLDYDRNGFISRKKAGMRDVSFDTSLGFAGDDYNDDDYSGEDIEGDVDQVVSRKKKDERKYILVPVGEFEERFEV